MLSSDIGTLDGGPMAKYYQPYQIIPYLMKMRPQIKSRDRLSPPAYVKSLLNLRSARSNRLCINVFASHLEILEKLQPYLPPITRKFLLVRKDIIK